MATNNAWNSTLTLQYAIQVGNSTGEIASIATGSANQLLMSGGAAANPAWSTATFPATSTTGDILYASANNVWSDLAAGTTGYVLQMGASVPGWAALSSSAVTSITGTVNQILPVGPSTGSVTLSLDTTLIAPGSLEVTSGFTIDAGVITFTPLTNEGVVTTTATGVISSVGPGSSGQVLTSQGIGMPPVFAGSTVGIATLVGDDTNTASGASVTITGGGNNVILTSGNNASTLTFNTPNITINAGINGNTGNVGIGFNTATISGTNGGSGSNDLVVIGYNAMQNSPGAGDNDQSVFIGAFAGNNAGLSGSCLRNTVIGYNSGTALNSTDNVLVGWNAGQVATGGQITVVGSNAGIAMTTDGNCDIFGAESGRSLAGSNFNQFFGSYAGWKITTGSNNVLIGQSAGFAYATGTESGNIILGGGINGTNGENNIMRLGNDGTGNNYATPTSQTYMAGVYGNAPAAAEFVIINASGQLGTSSGGGGGIATIDGDSGTASGATVDIVGTANEITTTGDNASTLTLSIPSVFIAPGSIAATTSITATLGNITATAGDVVLTAGNIDLTYTNAAGTTGLITAGGVPLISTLGTGNMFAGVNVANLTFNTGAATSNTIFGSLAFEAVTTGANNTAVGYSTLSSNSSGSNNIAIGLLAGSAITTSSNNIDIGHTGIVADSGVIRIGTSGTHTSTFISGIEGVSVSNLNYVTINTATGQMGSAPVSGNLVSSIAGTANEITASAATGAVTLSIPSTFIAPGSVEVTSGFTVDAGTITLTPLTIAGPVITNASGVISSQAVLGIANGGTNANAMATTDGVVYYDGTRLVTTAVGTAGQVLTSNGIGMAPTYQGGSVGISSVNGDSGTASGATITIAGTTHEITTTGDNAATLTISVPTTFIAPGTIASITTNAAGTNFLLPVSSSTAGQLQINGDRFLHGFGGTFLGDLAGNFTGTGVNNTGIGQSALNGLTTGSSNTALGQDSLIALTTGSSNTCLGQNTGSNYTTGETNNILIGAGVTGTAAESNVTRIGSGITKCFIAGIEGVVVSNLNYVTINTATGQLGSSATTIVSSIAGTANQIAASASTGSVTLSTPSTFIAPGSAASTTTTSIGTNLLLPTTTASTSGVVEVNGTSFMHSYGTMNTFLGSGSGNFTLTGAQNTCLGNGAGASLTTGGANTFLGQSAANAGTALNNSTIIGWAALGQATNTTETVVIGSDALSSTTGEADNSVYIGALVAENVTTAAQVNRNVVIGYNAAASWTTTSSLDNIYIGGDVTGANGENNTVRIGNQGTGAYQQNVAYIAGIYQGGGTQHGVLINSDGLLGTVVSSRRFKNSIEDMGDLSSDIYKLRPRKFLYNSRPEDGVQTGLIAEEVQEVMPQLAAYDSSGQVDGVRYHELPALLLNELQKLQARVQELESKLAKMGG